MGDFVKVRSLEFTVTTANTIGRANLVRAYAPTTAKLTFANTSGTIGEYTMYTNLEQFFIKEPDDTIASSNAVYCTAIAYK